jgi:hypothetical protein
MQVVNVEQRIAEAETIPVIKERIRALRNLRVEVCQQAGRIPCGSVWVDSRLVAGRIERLTGEPEN